MKTPINLTSYHREDLKYFLELREVEERRARLMLRQIDAQIIEQVPEIPEWVVPEYQKAYREKGFTNLVRSILA